MSEATHITHIHIHLDRLEHNLRRLRETAGNAALWPVIKADAYGHGAHIVAPHLVRLGCTTLGVADVTEAAALLDSGIEARFIVLSAALPEHAEALVHYRCEPVACTEEMIEALSREAVRQQREVAVHLKVDTGMGRVGVRPDEAPKMLERIRALPGLRPKGLMSHFPRADEADKAYSLAQLERFTALIETSRAYGIEVRHIANSAGLLDLPASRLDAVRPGIALYGLRPSAEIANPLVNELKPVLEWKSRITFLKEVRTGTGLSYGHSYRAAHDTLIATVPVGYGDGLDRPLSNRMEMLVDGVRCRQVGRITMDQTLLDVTPLRGRVRLGDEVVIIGRRGGEEIAADELAATLGTINYEIVTAIAHRVPRIAV